MIDSSQSCVEPAGHVWYFQDFCEMHNLIWLLFIQWFSCVFIKCRLMMQRWCWGNSSLSSTSRGSSNWRWTAILEYGKGEEACLMIDCEYEMALALWSPPCFQLAVGVEVWISPYLGNQPWCSSQLMPLNAWRICVLCRWWRPDQILSICIHL